MSHYIFYTPFKANRTMDVSEFDSFLYDYVGGGPVQAFPPNEAIFSNKNPRTVHVGETVAIPWSKNRIRLYIQSLRETQALLCKTSADFQKQVGDAYETLGKWCFGCDLVACLTGLVAGPGIGMAENAGKMACVPEGLLKCSTKINAGRNTQMLSNVVMKVMPAAGAEFSAGAVSYMMGLVSADPSQSNFTFTVRHAFGFWTPSYWASLYDVVVNDEDLEVWLYGQGAAERAFREKLLKDLMDALERINKRIKAAEAHANDTFWLNRLNVNQAANRNLDRMRSKMLN